MKDCISSIKCCVDGCAKKHHTLLHLESPHQGSINFTNKQDFTKSDKLNTFLLVITATIIHGTKTTVDSSSDTTLITPHLAKILKINRKQRKLNIIIAISTSVSVRSKLSKFSIC